MNIETRSIEIKELNTADAGGFAGYPSRFYDLDSYGDIVMPGAFAKCIPAFLERGFTAHSHDWGYEGVIGYPTVAREDAVGLYAETAFHSTPDAQMVRTKAQERIAAGKGVYLSIGFYTGREMTVSAEDYDVVLPTYLAAMEPDAMEALIERCRQFGEVRLVFEIDLYEYSIVTAPALKSAEVVEVRSGDTPRVAAPGAVTFEEELKAALGAVEAVGAVTTRARDIQALRLKKGAAISQARKDRLQALLDAMEAGAADLRALLEETAPAEEGKSIDVRLRLARARTETVQRNLGLQLVA